ncbi:MAG TPA: hypothetical protein VNZ86_02775 [Bacteroidia bacterium]|jgi:hypothetical protein|nr:hypothetical protein [Bacteroidia bacterium]
MIRNLALIAMLFLLSCHPVEKPQNPFRTGHILTGTCWSSNHGYYHIDYYFLTDSTARGEEHSLNGQDLPSSIQNMSPGMDSAAVSGAYLFNYRAHDSILYFIAETNGAPDTTLFIRKNFKDSAYYLSERSSAFGKEKIYLQSCKKQ